MAAFHVFVEGATDSTPAGLTRLATAIANHYGLPAADLLARLERGRFRVKGNIDRATAELYVRDLGRLGARCTIEEATVANSQRATPLPFPAVRPGTPAPVRATPPSGSPSPPRAATPPSGSPLPPRAATPPSGSPLPSRAATPPSGTPFQSGLSAAFSGDVPVADLGALARDDAPIALSSVDGADDPGSSAAASFEPPASALPASIGPAPAKSSEPAKPARPKDEPLDLFAPPEMQGEELKVDIADDEKELSARKRASTPVPVDDPPPPQSSGQRLSTAPVTRSSQPSLQVPNAPVDIVAPRSSKLGPLGDPRARFAAGVLLAVVLGFVPAHFIAGMREDSASAEIDRKVIAAQQEADTPDLYAALDSMRAAQLARKEIAHRNAAILGFAVWALVGSAIAFAWFKKIPWDALDA